VYKKVVSKLPFNGHKTPFDFWLCFGTLLCFPDEAVDYGGEAAVERVGYRGVVRVAFYKHSALRRISPNIFLTVAIIFSLSAF
jgi:hypothetical protein